MAAVLQVPGRRSSRGERVNVPIVLICCQILWLVIQAEPRKKAAEDESEDREQFEEL